MKACHAATLPRPGALYGSYPERNEAGPAAGLTADSGGPHRLLQRLLLPHAGRLHRAERAFIAALASPAVAAAAALPLQEAAAQAAARLGREGFSAQAVALGQAAAARAIEAETGQRVYRTQQIAAHALLCDRLVEMDTGEGKTLALLLAAACAALAQVPTHLVCANEYLAQRDAAAAAPVLARLGLAAAAIRHDMGTAERRRCYALPVVYVSAQELGFDYLRDRLSRRQPAEADQQRLRGLCLALIDEADSVLLDHARMPLALAEFTDHLVSDASARAAYRLSFALQRGPDFSFDPQTRRVVLAPGLLERCRAALDAAGLMDDDRLRGHVLQEALFAQHGLHRDVHYVEHGGSVVLIDPTTGRMQPGSVWSRGLHRMVCLKENQTPPPATRTATQITIQTLFGRYCKLGGISGTLRESGWQLGWFYGLRVHRVAPRAPSRRQALGLALYARRQEQYAALAQRVRCRSAAGQPVLVGTDSIAAADALSQHLREAGIEHQLLTARDDEREAALVAAAGAPGAVTVATNIAGRGTDIALQPQALAAGGLHVLCCTRNASPRIDRQLFGRAARNGQPGGAETVLSLEDPAFSQALPRWVLAVLARSAGADGRLPTALGRAAARLVQARSVWNDFFCTWELARHDRRTRELLAATGPLE